MYTTTSKVLAGVGGVVVAGILVFTPVALVKMTNELHQINSKLVVPTSTPLVMKATPTATPSATLTPTKGLKVIYVPTKAIQK